ncbi:MAG: ribonuclease catalytic domain-containing protein [Chloroflexi bacterium]|nr:ribonuclease catalytic domain-containing protein [Chloroflexota bacterium]
MKSGELVAARLSGEITIAKVLEVEASRVRLLLRQKKEARIPAERIVLATGVIASDDTDVERFKAETEALTDSIDVAEIWEVVRDEGTAMSLDELAELNWGNDAAAAQRVALLLQLDRETLYFVNEKGVYSPRSESAVEEIRTRREKEANNAIDAAALVNALAEGQLPQDMTAHQQILLRDVRGFAIHGDNYTRGPAVKTLLDGVQRATGDIQRLAFDMLVDAGVFSPDEPLELERENIPEEFSEGAIAEAANANDAAGLSQSNRVDLTDLPTVTIDDSGTEDRDDALSVGLDEPGIFKVGIHIADAGTLVLPGSELDIEADRRMATLYLPERKVPMLPPEVSTAKGSLQEGQTRIALSLLIRFDEAGQMLSWDVTPSVVRSDAALSYEEADGAISDAGHNWHTTLATLEKIASAIRARREQAGALNLERSEMLISVDENGRPDVRVIPRSTPSRQMVTEFMILCNSLMAEFCRDREIPAAYRSQTPADLTDLGSDLPPGVDLGDGPLRWYAIIRRLTPAAVSTSPAPHGGLGVPAYIQVTSPLRRYPDMVMQRQISQYLSTGLPLYTTDEISSVAQRADVQVRGLARIEEDRKKYWFLKYLKLGIQDGEFSDLFEATVLENQANRTAMLDLVSYPFRIRAPLPNAVLPGEVVTLRLHGVDLWRRHGQFVHAPDADGED